MKTVIYKIENLLTSDCYIGSTNNYSRRSKRHFEDLKSNKHHSIKLQRAVNKYNIKNFRIYILESFEFISKEYTLEREQYYLDTVKPKYNVCLTAGSQLGTKRNDNFKKKCSERMLGKAAWNRGLKLPKHSKELSEKRSRALKGRHLTQEVRDKISIANKGKILTQDHKNKLSTTKIENPVNNIVVEQYLNNELINTFISIGEACRKTGLSYQTIKNSINNINKKWKSKKNKWIWKVQIN